MGKHSHPRPNQTQPHPRPANTPTPILTTSPPFHRATTTAQIYSSALGTKERMETCHNFIRSYTYIPTSTGRYQTILDYTKQDLSISDDTRRSRDHAIPSDTRPYQTIPSDTERYPAILDGTKRYQAIPNDTERTYIPSP